MRAWPILLLTIFAVSAFADRLHIPQLPEAEYADTEVSTNIAVAPLAGSRKFSVEISLYADMTNNVEVAVGCDSIPADARLSAGESVFTVGWDSGGWFFASGGLKNRYEETVADAGCTRTLFMQIDIRENNSVRYIALSEDGGSVFTNAVAVPSPAECVWNLVKATSRGLTDASESISVKTNPYGLGIIFR